MNVDAWRLPPDGGTTDLPNGHFALVSFVFGTREDARPSRVIGPFPVTRE
jgi:hypothetical protein